MTAYQTTSALAVQRPRGLTAKLTANAGDNRDPWWIAVDGYIRPELRRCVRRRLLEQLTSPRVQVPERRSAHSNCHGSRARPASSRLAVADSAVPLARAATAPSGGLNAGLADHGLGWRFQGRRLMVRRNPVQGQLGSLPDRQGQPRPIQSTEGEGSSPIARCSRTLPSSSGKGAWLCVTSRV